MMKLFKIYFAFYKYWKRGYSKKLNEKCLFRNELFEACNN